MPTSATIEIVETYNVHCCTLCGVSYAITIAYEDRRRDDHANFYCPNGHAQHYPQKTEAEKQRERADRLAKTIERREADLRFEQRRLANERKSHAATKGQLTKTRKRAKHAMCPVDGCRRSFANVARHIANQHPGFVA